MDWGPQIGAALGFADPGKAIRKIYSRSPSEFDESTNIMIELSTDGGRQLVRLYNARGAALIAMKAQTPKGEAFRRWVLDVLEGKSDIDTGPMAEAEGVSLTVMHELRTMYLSRKGMAQLVRYLGMGLKTAEIARLLEVTPGFVTKRRRAAEYLGLAPKPLPDGRYTGSAMLERLTRMRMNAEASRQARRRALAAPTGETTDGE